MSDSEQIFYRERHVPTGGQMQKERVRESKPSEDSVDAKIEAPENLGRGLGAEQHQRLIELRFLAERERRIAAGELVKPTYFELPIYKPREMSLPIYQEPVQKVSVEKVKGDLESVVGSDTNGEGRRVDEYKKYSSIGEMNEPKENSMLDSRQEMKRAIEAIGRIGEVDGDLGIEVDDSLTTYVRTQEAIREATAEEQKHGTLTCPDAKCALYMRDVRPRGGKPAKYCPLSGDKLTEHIGEVLREPNYVDEFSVIANLKKRSEDARAKVSSGKARHLARLASVQGDLIEVEFGGYLSEDARKNRISRLEDKINQMIAREHEPSTMDVARQLGSEMYAGIAKVANAAAKVAFKSVAYPIVGNLSTRLQQGLEDKVGKEWYNAGDATKTSILTNLITYGLPLGYMINGFKFGENFEQNAIIWAYGAASTVGLGYVRSIIEENLDSGHTRIGLMDSLKPKGTVIGKILSYPIEWAIDGYSGIRNYFSSVKERAKEKKNGGSK